MKSVKKINYIDGYKISITFDDKKTKIVDLESYLDKGIFLMLRDPDYFKLVKLSYDTLVWPNEADFCPDVLYEIGKDIPEPKKDIRVQKKGIKPKTGRVKQVAYAMSKKRPKKSKMN